MPAVYKSTMRRALLVTLLLALTLQYATSQEASFAETVSSETFQLEQNPAVNESYID